MPKKTLGDIINAGLKVMGEPEITSFTSTNILQEYLIEAANNVVTQINEEEEYHWTYNRTILTTTDDITTEKVAATNASTTVTSVDDNGANATNFTNVTTDMWIRIGTDKDSYKVSAVQNSSSPHTITLETAYVGTTSTAASYVCFQDTYALTATDIDELKVITFGETGNWLSVLRGTYGDSRIEIFSDIDDLIAIAGGDLHRDTSGKPRAVALYYPDSSDQQQIVLWPYPKDQYLFQIYYQRKYTDVSDFSTTSMFGGDAPDIAYVAVEDGVRAAALLWDDEFEKAAYYEQKKNLAVQKIKARENRQDRAGNAMSVDTNRRYYGRGMEIRSQLAFDTKPGWRR